MRMLLALLLAIGLLIKKVGADQCGRFRFYDGWTVLSPGYPEEKNKYTCNAYLPFQGTRGGIHLIQMYDIQLYVTTYNNVDRCSLSFQFGSYSWPCLRTSNDCIVYYNRDSCLPYIRNHYASCRRLKTTSSGIYAHVRCWAIDAYIFLVGTRYPKGLKLTYNYITCPQETTTTTTTARTTTTTARRTTTMSTTIADSTFNYSEASTATIDDPASGLNDYVHIIVPSAVSFFVILMVALIVAVLMLRRKSRKNNRNERPGTAAVPLIPSVSHTPSVSSSTHHYELMAIVTPVSHHTEYIQKFPTSPPPLPPPRQNDIAGEDPDIYLQPITRKDDTRQDSVGSNSDDGGKIYETPIAQAPKNA